MSHILTHMFLLAQSSPSFPSDLGPWLQLGGGLGALGGGGLTAYLVYHLTTKLIPELINRFAMQLEKAQDKFTLELKEARADYKEENAAERKQCDERFDKILALMDLRYKENQAQWAETKEQVRDAKHEFKGFYQEYKNDKNIERLNPQQGRPKKDNTREGH